MRTERAIFGSSGHRHDNHVYYSSWGTCIYSFALRMTSSSDSLQATSMTKKGHGRKLGELFMYFQWHFEANCI